MEKIFFEFTIIQVLAVKSLNIDLIRPNQFKHEIS